MSTQLKGPAAFKSRPMRPKHRTLSAPVVDHATIVRMAAAQAAGREAERHDMIATAAYFRAQQRGFEPGHELEDWLAAENDVTHLQQLSIMVSGADAP